MAEIIDITDRLKAKKWPTQLEKEYALRHIRTSELTVIINKRLGGLLQTVGALPTDSQLPVYALHQFSSATLVFIKEVFSRINAAPRIREPEKMRILIAEAMYRDLELLLLALPDKIESYKSDEF